MDLSHATAVILVKIRIWNDLRTMHNATRALQGQHKDSATSVLPREIIDQIRGELVRGRPTFQRHNLVNSSVTELEAHIATVKAQIRLLYKWIEGANTHFWPIMASFENLPALTDLEERRKFYKQGRSRCGSLVGAVLTANDSFRAWNETDGACQILAGLRRA